MEKEFVNYNQSLALKELGFDEDCLMYIDDEEDLINDDTAEWIGAVKAPLKQQVFRWFRDKHNLSGIPDDKSYSIWKLFHGGRDCIMEVYPLNNFEEAESACIDKLIEIIKNKKDEKDNTDNNNSNSRLHL